jgi:ATP-dependent DNA helicase RecG
MFLKERVRPLKQVAREYPRPPSHRYRKAVRSNVRSDPPSRTHIFPDPTRATEAITRGGADGTNYTLLVVLILAVSVVAVLWRREVNAGTAREERIKALEAEVKTAQTATAAAQTDKAEAIGRLTTDHATAQGALYAAHATALREQHEAYSTQLNELRAELSAGRQAYIICPRIDEPDPNKQMTLLAKSVKEEAKRLKKSVFSEFEIDIVHSKLKDDEKERVMKRFKKGEIKILVATSVVEVGVNVPNATVIIIEGGERFGLAQLHQLRGRVIRSNDQAYCYVFAETKSKKSLERLQALQSSASGFELAEWDLKLRGPGELSGNKQWGISDIGMEALKNIKMVEAARAEAHNLLETDETLGKFPQIRAELEKRKKEEIHFE